MTAYGASPEEWAHFDLILGLGKDLLPVVSNPTAVISPQSNMAKVGKTPSRYNGAHEVVGVPAWTQKEATDSELTAWAANPDYGICLQTRLVRAIDVDIPDEGEAARVLEAIRRVCPAHLPLRSRADSSKFLVVFALAGDLGYRRLKTSCGVIEQLATGRQFVAAGQHQDGARYEWVGGLPDGIPLLSLAGLDALWDALEHEFAVEAAAADTPASNKAAKLADVFANDPVAKYLLDGNLVKKSERDGRLHIECPWDHDHTSDTGVASTTYWPANTGGYVKGHFACLHAHCAARTDSEFLDELGFVEDLSGEFAALADSPVVLPEGGVESGNRFTVVSASEFVGQKTHGWIIKHVLPQGEMGVIFGESGSGKTFLVLDMCLAIACGVPWRGEKVTQGRVVYIASEGAGGLRKRLQAQAQHNDLDLSDVDFGVIPVAPNFLEKTDVLDVAKAVLASGGASVVVVDTWAQSTPGGNENSGEDMGKALSHCKGLHRATGAMVLLVHHSGKDASKGARGWSGLRAAAEAEIEVVRNKEQRAAVITKLKDDKDNGEYGFRLNTVVLGIDADGDEITSCVLEHTSTGAPVKARPKYKGELRDTMLNCYADLFAGEPVNERELIAACHKRIVADGNLVARPDIAIRRCIAGFVKSEEFELVGAGVLKK